MSANSVWHWTVLVELVVLLAVAFFVFFTTKDAGDERKDEP
jgi:hypothetical protein